MHHDVSFDDQNTLRSNQFEDIYFSIQDGLAETKHVFLDSNHLPQAWANKPQFTIAETGFGTGLNTLSAWKLFEETSTPNQYLDLISIEKHPLTKGDIARALEPFKNEFGSRIDHLLQQYPLLIPGFHRIWLSDRVTLTLIFDDAATGFSQVDNQIDAWFLDGFAPAKNPDMWSKELFQQMARLSHSNTTFSTFTAAGLVKRGLESIGFTVEKTTGFGRKRDMLIGQFKTGECVETTPPKNVAIIGGGLAGMTTAFCLKRRGINTTVFEKEDQIAQGASGNQIALINPHLYADKNSPQTQLSTAGYAFLLRTLKQFDDIDFKQTGNIYLSNSVQKQDRFPKFIDRLGWAHDHMRAVSKTEISQMIGQIVHHDGLFYADAGMINPQKLVTAYSKDIEIKTGRNVTLDDLKDYDTIVVANGVGAIDFLPDLPLKPVRGQVTHIKAPSDFPHGVSYGGYASPAYNGVMAVGASFDHESDKPVLKAQDNDDNLALLTENIPSLPNDFEIVDQWAGVRCTTKDYFPIIGKDLTQDNLYINTALGSHGTVTSLIGGELIASQLTGTPLPLPADIKKALSSQRFLDRELKKAG